MTSQASTLSRSKKKTTTKKKKKEADAPEVLELEYHLGDLPTSQHRAGLAGLVMMVRWLEELPAERRAGLCELIAVEPQRVVLRVDRAGLIALFDEVYAAVQSELEQPRPFKRGNETVPPLRTEERQVADANGKTKTQTIYVYPSVIPRGAFLAARDPGGDGNNGPWVKLWRDTIWSIFRGVPATRRPFAQRAAGESSGVAEDLWPKLCVADATDELPSTYFLGAQAKTAENVCFRDRARQLFLLHFWPFAAQIYVPAVLERDGSREFVGVALAVPDVTDLQAYSEVYPEILSLRPIEMSGYRPRGAIVDVALEGGLELMRLLAARIGQREGVKDTADLVGGIDIIHASKEGNNVRILGTDRVQPDAVMIDRYAGIKDAYWSPLFRRQRLLNLVSRSPWWCGFGKLCSTTPTSLTLESKPFRHDARQAFEQMEIAMEQGHSDSELEKLVYQMINSYLRRRLASKYDLVWEQVKGNESREHDYRERREKLAKEAFLAVRSRTGEDFVEYFTATLCSVPQHLGEEKYLNVSSALLRDPERVRTLTLLALSAA